MSELERVLFASEVLTLPPVAQQLVAQLSGPNAALAELADTIAGDPGLAARFLRLASCSVLPATGDAQSVPAAVAALGAGESRSMSLGLALVDMLQRGQSHDGLDLIFRTALARGLAARRLGTTTGDWHADEAFLTGLVADVAIPALCRIIPEYGELMDHFHRGDGELVTYERATLGTDHGVLSPRILEHWGFPARILDPIRHHHAQLKATGDIERRGAILGGADRLARALCINSLAPEIQGLDRSLAARIGVFDSRIARIAADLPDQIREIADLFNVPARSQRNYVEVLADADRREAGLSASEPDELDSLPPGGGDGFRDFDPETFSETPLERDEETGLLARTSFERMLEVFHRRARQLRSPLSLLVLSIENLKEIEEQHGVAASAAVVSSIGQRVQSFVRRSDPCARIAFDQVAVLAPGCSKNHAPHMAERVRLRVESEPVEVAGQSVAVQLSIGTSASLPHHDSAAPLSLLQSTSSS